MRCPPSSRTGARRNADPKFEKQEITIIQTGTITKLFAARGFGFVRGDDEETYFAHHTSSAIDFASLALGGRVAFEAEPSPRGPRAVGVRLLEPDLALVPALELDETSPIPSIALTFAGTGIGPRSVAALARDSITIPVAVQSEAIPLLLAGRDVVIQAVTGSGKTLAFLLPMIERLRAKAPGPRGLVVVPTRELAIQVESVLASLDAHLVRALLYGGIGYATQTTALRSGVDVVVGTPGRLLDMVGRGLLSLSRVQYLVLDEADVMFDAGFAPDVERILALTYQPQTVLASATMPEWVETMIDRHLADPAYVTVVPEEESKLEHGLVDVDAGAKLRTLSDILKTHGSTIVFGRTKHGVKKLNRDLLRLGHNSVELQGNMAQSARQHVLEGFRQARSDVLVATNVAARGLDLTGVELVVNYELPETPDWLTHRIGRTARMGERGRALTFVTAQDAEAWRKLRRMGAPELPTVDLNRLLRGEWGYLPEGPRTTARGPRRAGRVRAGVA